MSHFPLETTYDGKLKRAHRQGCSYIYLMVFTFSENNVDPNPDLNPQNTENPPVSGVKGVPQAKPELADNEAFLRTLGKRHLGLSASLNDLDFGVHTRIM